MIRTLAVLVFLSFCTILSAADQKITAFGENDYQRMLLKYSAMIENNTFDASELIAEVSGIRSIYVTALLYQLREQLSVKNYLSRDKDTTQISALDTQIKRATKATPTAGVIEISPVSARQYTAKRAYVSGPHHTAMTGWSYDWSDTEPFMLGIKGSNETSSVHYDYNHAYSTWYRLFLNFDLTGVPYPINILDAYIRIDRVNYYWGKDEEGGMSVAYLTTTEVKSFTDLDLYGTLTEATVAPYGYGSSNEWLKISPLTDLIPQWLDGYAHGLVINFKRLSDYDHGVFFHAKKIYRRNIKLVIRYEM